jgi:hypothetical protein
MNHAGEGPHARLPPVAEHGLTRNGEEEMGNRDEAREPPAEGPTAGEPLALPAGRAEARGSVLFEVNSSL